MRSPDGAHSGGYSRGRDRSSPNAGPESRRLWPDGRRIAPVALGAATLGHCWCRKSTTPRPGFRNLTGRIHKPLLPALDKRSLAVDVPTSDRLGWSSGADSTMVSSTIWRDPGCTGSLREVGTGHRRG